MPRCHNPMSKTLPDASHNADTVTVKVNDRHHAEAPFVPRDVTRSIPCSVKCLLWGRAAGRCEFAGCNTALWKSPVTQEQTNIAQKAHIYSFSPSGPRGNNGILKDKLNDLSNLMLVCPPCHIKIDKTKQAGRYTAELLQSWKKDHEQRIGIVTSIHPNKRSHILLYGSKIGSVDSPLSFNEATLALFPRHYPAEDKAIELGMTNSSLEDRDAAFWRTEERNLVRLYSQRVSERLADKTIVHLSVFALAPQPLLVRLGSLLTDINQVDVYTRNREPVGWGWRERRSTSQFIVRRPRRFSTVPALVLSLSGDITDDRITKVLGHNIALWRVSIKRPNNDFLRSKQQMEDFRKLIRLLMGEIGKAHGQNTLLHVFPAVPAALAVELGRVRQPKAHVKWRVYDQASARRGFAKALDIT